VTALSRTGITAIRARAFGLAERNVAHAHTGTRKAKYRHGGQYWPTASDIRRADGSRALTSGRRLPDERHPTRAAAPATAHACCEQPLRAVTAACPTSRNPRQGRTMRPEKDSLVSSLVLNAAELDELREAFLLLG
jgi:hypothetical protein